MLWSIDFWKPTVIFNFKDFLVEYNSSCKTTFTRFPDNHWAGGEPSEHDEHHSSLLGITSELSGLQRHLALHAIAMEYYDRRYSMILWHAAHPDETAEANLDESWLSLALQYHSRGKQGPDERNDAGAISAIRQKNISPDRLGSQLQTLLDTAYWL